MKYYSTNYRDTFTCMRNALEKDGHVPVSNYNKADMIFLDREPTGNEARWEIFDNLAKRKPMFLYPHTTYSFWLWDGYTKPSPHVSCNFIASEAARLSLETYGYPCRAEVVGYTRPSPLQPFRPTAGKHLAHAQPRLLGRNGRFYRPGDALVHDMAMEWIYQYRQDFEKITIFYSFTLEISNLSKYKDVREFDFVCVAADARESQRMDTAHGIRQLQGVDLFIGSNTLGYIAITQGIPTILIGHNNDVPLHSTNNGNHYAEYEKYCAFPYRLSEMTAEQAKALCIEMPEEIKAWKEMNIGHDFDAEKFLKVVHEYL